MGLGTFGLWAAGTCLAETTDQHGVEHELSKAGTYTVVDFAAAWCQPCYKALPRLEDLAAEYPEIRFLVVSVDDEIDGRNQIVEDLELTLPVIWDEDHHLIQRFSPRSFPATYVLDPSGKPIYQHTGFDREKWQALVSYLRALPEKASERPAKTQARRQP